MPKQILEISNMETFVFLLKGQPEAYEVVSNQHTHPSQLSLFFAKQSGNAACFRMKRRPNTASHGMISCTLQGGIAPDESVLGPYDVNVLHGKLNGDDDTLPDLKGNEPRSLRNCTELCTQDQEKRTSRQDK
ncbi:hypothetical protein T265_04861 [Opisthorchis viverrini]|uniref:Uncharacterized protein n=1 Tax=Opisthorchis viverrini TaxID=6198 RepID=A0A074ZY82_OPIVI|nr:hypothetical protein T265_04861 [Opisthorchis viverrini]KER28260.1 hypothetical protein T265_04861 [Opisthorchis viverrini]